MYVLEMCFHKIYIFFNELFAKITLILGKMIK